MSVRFQKGFIVPLILVILTILAGGGAYYSYWNEEKQGTEVNQENDQFIASTTVNEDVNASAAEASLTATTSTAQSFITILSPKAGEIVSMTQPFQITWQMSPDYQNAVIRAAIDVEIGSCLVGSAKGSQGSTQVVLQNAGCPPINPGQHTITLQPFDSVTGRALSGAYQSPAFIVTSPSSSTAWQTYTNNQYGFSVQYPSTATIESGTHFGGGILNPGQVQFSIGFPNHQTGGPPGFEVLAFEVQPISSSTGITLDQLYQGYEKGLGSAGYNIQKFQLGNDTGVFYVNNSCSGEIDVFHNGYEFSMPALFGTIFIPQSGMASCATTGPWAGISNDYLQTLSTFKFTN
jgi:hypothetical protein